MSESRGIFLTWEWLYHWAKHYLGGNRLWILLLVDQHQRTRAIAPFYIRPVRLNRVMAYQEIAFLGTEEVGSCYLDIIAERKSKRVVIRRLYDFLFNQAGQEWDVLTLGEIPAESSSIEPLVNAFEGAGKVVETIRTTYCPRVCLPRSFSDYTQTLSTNTRYNLQRKRRALQRLGAVSYRHILKGPEVRQTFDAFVGLHEKRWTHNGAGGGAFHRERFRTFHNEILEVFALKGWLSLSLLTLDNHPLAGIYAFIYNGTYYFYLPAFDPDRASQASPGMLLLAHCIDQAIRERYGLFDLLQGDADYKATWANDVRRSLTLRGYNRSWPALVPKLIESAKQSIKILVR